MYCMLLQGRHAHLEFDHVLFWSLTGAPALQSVFIKSSPDDAPRLKTWDDITPELLKTRVGLESSADLLRPRRGVRKEMFAAAQTAVIFDQYLNPGVRIAMERLRELGPAVAAQDVDFLRLIAHLDMVAKLMTKAKISQDPAAPAPAAMAAAEAAPASAMMRAIANPAAAAVATPAAASPAAANPAAVAAPAASSPVPASPAAAKLPRRTPTPRQQQQQQHAVASPTFWEVQQSPVFKDKDAEPFVPRGKHRAAPVQQSRKHKAMAPSTAHSDS